MATLLQAKIAISKTPLAFCLKFYIDYSIGFPAMDKFNGIIVKHHLIWKQTIVTGITELYRYTLAELRANTLVNNESKFVTLVSNDIKVTLSHSWK